jgi:hypothetical protein
MSTKRKYLVAALTLSALAGCAKSPESTVESFYKAVAKGEITEAQTYLSSQILGMMGQAKITAALSSETMRIGKCGGIKDLQVKLEGQGEVRSGTTTVTYGGSCAVKTEKTKLVKEDGKWKLGAGK